MNLDDSRQFEEIDIEGMLAQIDALPDQLAQAWNLGVSSPCSAIAHNRRLLNVYCLRCQRFSATDEEIKSFVCKQGMEG